MVTFVLMTLASATTAFGATTANQVVTVNVAENLAITVNPTALTYDVNADNIGVTQNYNVLSQSNVRTDMTIIASALTTPAGTDPLALSNFSWIATGGNSGTLSTTSQSMITNVAKAPKGGSTSVPVVLTVTAPFGTDPGQYVTTVTYTISKHT